MKKVKKACRVICIFLTALCISILPTFLRTKEEINILLQKPEYWVSSVIIAAIVTFGIEHSNNSKK